MGKQVQFVVSGNLFLPTGARPVLNRSGEICAYRLKDGRTVKPWLTIEVHNPKTDDYQDAATFDDLKALGIEGLDYDANHFVA